MKTATTILKYLLAVLIVGALGGLAGWYFFLHSQEQQTSAVNTARGLGTSAPGFSNGNGSTASLMGGGSTLVSTTSTSNGPVVRLWEVDRAPVAGMGFSTQASSTTLYYVERGNGYVFEADPTKQTTTRLTTTLMPKTYEALVGPDGSVIMRGIDKNGVVTTYAGTFATSTASSSQALSGVYLPSGIRAIAASPSSQNFFYLLASGSGVFGFTATWNGTKATSIFSSPLPDWRALLDGDSITLFQSPADGVEGDAYSLSQQGVLSQLIAGIPGLTILTNASSSATLYGASTGSGLSLYAQIAGKAPTQLPLSTTAEKCVWAPGNALTAYCAVPAQAPTGNFLDSWYQGDVHTADSWWQVDASVDTAKLLYSPQVSDNVSLDIQDPVVDQSGNYIAFKDAADQSLWILRIAQ